MHTYYKYVLIVFTLFSIHAFSANELYINGPTGATSTATLFDSTALIFVNGEINNADGLFINSGGTIEVTGNWNNTSTNNKYQSTGTEKFYGTAQQTISGNMNGTTKSAAGFDNQFYNLKVYRNSTITTTPNKYITISNNVNVANTIDFEASTPNTTYAGTGTNEAVIRTDAASPSNVGSYANEIYLRNPSTTALSGYAAISTNGQDRYIEGKLRRQVNAVGVYDFPVGFVPTFKDGMEAFSVKFNTTPPSSNSLLGYIEDQSQAILIRYVLCDVGKDPGPGNDPFPNCTGTPDGIYDYYYLDASNDLSHDWKALAPGFAPGSVDYDITLYPGTGLDNLANYKDIPAACGAPYQSKLLRVIAKDGVVGGTTQVGPGNWYPFSHLSSYVWCQFPAAATQAITLGNQTGFSTFRIHGTNTFSSTALPVQLTAFDLTAVDNNFFKLDWQTASELNNYGFEVQRSLDGTDFSSIGFIRGNGTTSMIHNYALNDSNVVAEINYYYRLKIIDFDGTFKYSRVLIGRLRGENSFIVSEFYPNPTNDNVSVNVFAPASNKMTINLFDIVGQLISTTNYELKSGWNKVDLNTSNLAAATYIASIINHNTKTVSKKIIKK